MANSGLSCGPCSRQSYSGALKTCANVQNFPAGSDEMARYIHGDVVPSDKKGWCLVTADGYSIGWGKGDGRVLKNHYPKGLRR